MIILTPFIAFLSHFGRQQEAKVVNTKQGNQDHIARSKPEGSSSTKQGTQDRIIRSRPEGSSNRYLFYLGILCICFFFFHPLIPYILDLFISDGKTLWLS